MRAALFIFTALLNKAWTQVLQITDEYKILTITKIS